MDIQVGAKIVCNLKSENLLTNEEAERLIAFTNNSGPLFIIGTVGLSLLNNSRIGYILLMSHIIACIVVGIVFRNWKKSSLSSNKRSVKKVDSKNTLNFGEILNNSVKNSITTSLNIGGFIVFFSVIISILNSSGFLDLTGKVFEKIGISKVFGNSVISGIIELTNGLKMISLLEVSKFNLCIISFLIGFGGISVVFQVYSIIAKENISIKPYLYGKLLQGVFSFVITYFILNYCNW